MSKLAVEKKSVRPSSSKIDAHAEAVLRRYRDQSSPEFLPQFKNEYWSVLLPSLSWSEHDCEGENYSLGSMLRSTGKIGKNSQSAAA